MTLGTKLQNLRKQTGMSQETLAGQLGVSRQAVSRWELDISLPETENIIKLAKIFNVSFDYLLNDEITENTTSQNQPGHTGRNIYIDNIVEFLKKYGYCCGYILSAISAYCFVGYTITLLGFTKVFSIAGEMSFVGPANIGGAMFGILVMYILLSLCGIFGGLWLAKYLKKKTEKYRIIHTDETDRR